MLCPCGETAKVPFSAVEDAHINKAGRGVETNLGSQTARFIPSSLPAPNGPVCRGNDEGLTVLNPGCKKKKVSPVSAIPYPYVSDGLCDWRMNLTV